MSKSRRIPRKLKKELRKSGCIDKYGESIVHCIQCQKRWATCGYDRLFCERCEDEFIESIEEKL